ncbi:hypothetical protein Y032_0017g3388 [Ancylostoma ceylanicum]|uniref:Uncharacterized protein n=1 Tax=Ancylostoma ceylanicum TaxID=53326 RepID=A0A016V701_9BILA|nr:hypothetical protein Y032_0017g3388 [Ancylostoma ceylanicum]
MQSDPETKMIENGSAAVHSVKQLLQTRQGQQKVNFKTDTKTTHSGTQTRLPPSACWFYGDMHFFKAVLIDIINASAAKLSDTKKDTAFHLRTNLNDSARRNGRSTRQTVRSDAIFIVASINYNQYRRYATVKLDDFHQLPSRQCIGLDSDQ